VAGHRLCIMTGQQQAQRLFFLVGKCLETLQRASKLGWV
jgi:hypothetical protein